MGGLGKNSENLSINLPSDLVRKIETFALADHRTKSNYCRKVLEEHVRIEELKSKPGKPVADAATTSTASTANLTESTSRAMRPGKKSPGGAART